MTTAEMATTSGHPVTTGNLPEKASVGIPPPANMTQTGNLFLAMVSTGPAHPESSKGFCMAAVKSLSYTVVPAISVPAAYAASVRCMKEHSGGTPSVDPEISVTQPEAYSEKGGDFSIAYSIKNPKEGEGRRQAGGFHRRRVDNRTGSRREADLIQPDCKRHRKGKDRKHRPRL